mmetsp:Transcript_22372/g.79849  ORF Transcript_22372/g.79849 Transcript_22372/m.79849 type:complete len:254 (-) Transcript_22372:399-1160(-)
MPRSEVTLAGDASSYGKSLGSEPSSGTVRRQCAERLRPWSFARWRTSRLNSALPVQESNAKGYSIQAATTKSIRRSLPSVPRQTPKKRSSLSQCCQPDPEEAILLFSMRTCGSSQRCCGAFFDRADPRSESKSLRDSSHVWPVWTMDQPPSSGSTPSFSTETMSPEARSADTRRRKTSAVLEYEQKCGCVTTKSASWPQTVPCSRRRRAPPTRSTVHASCDGGQPCSIPPRCDRSAAAMASTSPAPRGAVRSA